MRKLIQSLALFALLSTSGFMHDGAFATRTGSEEQGQPTGCSSRPVLLDVIASQKDGQQMVVPLSRFPDSEAFFFVAGMTIDADGAPNAYHPEDTGLDELANAGVPGRWDGIITDREGNPFIQEESDPSPGYYVSCTSLADETKKFTDPTRYVDASAIPYIALPEKVADRGGALLGDFALVSNLRNGRSAFAIYADIGTIGEGSIALAEALGIRSNARNGGASDGILYVIFPGSGNLHPRTLDEINTEGEDALSELGGMKAVSACVESSSAILGTK